jgi:hypothetical protein
MVSVANDLCICPDAIIAQPFSFVHPGIQERFLKGIHVSSTDELIFHGNCHKVCRDGSVNVCLPTLYYLRYSDSVVCCDPIQVSNCCDEIQTKE